MADFDPPFGQSGERRLPTTVERSEGFACGPASKELFNGLFHRLESEVGEVIGYAGLTPSDGTYTQLREAIVALIAAATGGGATSDYLLMSQARARLPIFPEIHTTNNVMPVISPSPGTVRISAGATFSHRGIFPITTVLTDFPTDPSKTYHLRWNPTDGFTLKDLASVVYNPTSAAESNIAFDTVYDDMLVARIVTNSSNVANITALSNAAVLRKTGEEVAAVGSLVYPNTEDGVRPTLITQYTAVNVNFARVPDVYLTAINDPLVAKTILDTTGKHEWNWGARPLNRYQIAVWGQGDVDIWIGWAVRA